MQASHLVKNSYLFLHGMTFSIETTLHEVAKGKKDINNE